MSDDFKEDVLSGQFKIMSLSNSPAQAVSIALTIAVNIMDLHLKARTFKVGINEKIFEVEIKELKG